MNGGFRQLFRFITGTNVSVRCEGRWASIGPCLRTQVDSLLAIRDPTPHTTEPALSES
jgi:hypothetical protein